MSDPARGPSCEWRRAIFCGVLFLQFCATQSRGQDVAGAARREQERKAAQHKSYRHVYTEEDLKRKTILTPDDQARVEARKKQQNATPSELNAQQGPNESAPQTESLGEVARRYRQEKAAHEAELAEEKKLTPFRYEFPDGSFAATDPGVAPLSGPAPQEEFDQRTMRTRRPAHRFSPRATDSHARISPFQPRPLGVSPFAPTLVPPVLPALSAGSLRAALPLEENPILSPAGVGLQRVQVERGQSWWKLAELYLGSGARWPELRMLNADAGGPPELLRLGASVVVPELGKKREVSSPQTIKVHKGDSLWSLAHDYFGRGSRWTCLASANPQVLDYTHLTIGSRLQLPDALHSCRTEKLDNPQK